MAGKAAKTSAPAKQKKAVNVEKEYGTGRRKNSTARVWISRGNGKVIVNGRDVTGYFGRPVLEMIVQQPFKAINASGEYDVWCTVSGGGLSGQAGAIRLGISRALVELNEAFRPILRQHGFLTRDARVVERKKYGRAKARRSFQFSKR